MPEPHHETSTRRAIRGATAGSHRRGTGARRRAEDAAAAAAGSFARGFMQMVVATVVAAVVLAAGTAGAAGDAGPGTGDALAASDTLVITAPREDLAEVIAEVGARMRRAEAASPGLSYTTTARQVEWYGPDDTTGTAVRTVAVRRHRMGPDGAVGSVTIGSVEQRFENGILVAETRRDGGAAAWREAAAPLLDQLPFADGAAGRYRYEVRERVLVGNTLLYRIGFAPRNRLDALPDGEAWVDFAGWTVRRLTAWFPEGRPLPTVMLAGVPVYRMAVEPRDGRFLPVDVWLELEVRDVPLVAEPRRVGMRVVTSEVAVPGSLAGDSPGRDDARDPREFWLDEAAAADSLAEFWDRVDEPWRERVPGLLRDQAPVLAVAAGGGSEAARASERAAALAAADGALAALGSRGRPWVWSVGPAWPRFNRAQGPVFGVDFGLRRAGAGSVPVGEPVSVGGRLAWGAAAGQGEAAVALETGRGRWRWRCEAVAAEVRAFAGDGRRPLRDAAAFLYGADPNRYFTERRLGVEVQWTAGPAWRLRAGAGLFDQRPLEAATRWNLAGRTVPPGETVAAERAEGRRFEAGAGIERGAWGVEAWAMRVAPGDGGSRTLLAVDGRWTGWDRVGNRWIVTGGWRRWSRPAPAQDQKWLGDSSGLWGWPAGSLRGDRGAWLAAEAGLNVMLPGAVQPLVFLGVGWTGRAGLRGFADDSGASGGWRGSVGAGLGRRLGIPVFGDRQHLRLWAGWPVGPGAKGPGPRWILALEASG
ncbi:MAG: hypothetical protein AB7V45_14220 [Candidatus Krumholzibacteriia bacterium]